MDDFITICKTNDDETILLKVSSMNIADYNDEKTSILHQTIEHNLINPSLKVIELMVENQLFDLLKYPDYDGSTPLIMSCECSLIDVGNKLLDTGYSNPSHVDSYGYSALTLCCLSDITEEIGLKILNLDSSEYIGKACEDLDRTPLMYACFNSLERLSIKLAENDNSNILYVDSHTRKNALIYALDSGLDDVSDILISKMDDFKQVDIDGNTALIIACGNQMEKQALDILEKGDCLVETLESNDETALIMACANGMEQTSLKILEYCKENPDYFNHKDDEGLTAFDYACDNNLQKVIDVFITLLPVEKSISILIKNRLYCKLNLLINTNSSNEAVKKMIFDELCVSDVVDIISQVTSNESLENLEKYIKKLEESPIDCLICCKPTVTHYLFMPCKHVLKIDSLCLSKINECPLCRVLIDKKELVFLV
jgi:ankyrin repeat protein